MFARPPQEPQSFASVSTRPGLDAANIERPTRTFPNRIQVRTLGHVERALAPPVEDFSSGSQELYGLANLNGAVEYGLQGATSREFPAALAGFE